MLNRRTFLKSMCAIACAAGPHRALAGNLAPVPSGAALKSLADLPAIGAQRLAVADVQGRPVIVTFWASWCPPCRWEFEQLNKLSAAYRTSGLQIIGVNIFEDFGGMSSPTKQARFIADTAPVFPLVAGTDRTRADFGGVTRIPTVFLFDRTGQVAWSFVHARGSQKTHVTEQELSAELMALGHRPG